MLHKKATLFCIFLASCLISSGQLPSAADIFSQMFITTRNITSISYQAKWIYIDGDTNGTSDYADFRTWANKVNIDPVFGFLFHIQRVNKNESSDYYYTGSQAVEFHHKHKDSLQSKTTTMQQVSPVESPSLQTTKVAQGFIKELMATELTPDWRIYLDSMRVFDNGKLWVVEWEQIDASQDLTILHRLAFDKKNYLVAEVHRRSLWKGLSYKTDFNIKNIRINEEVEKDLTIPTQFAEYRRVKDTLTKVFR